MLEQLAATFASKAAGGLFAPDPGSAISGGTVEAFRGAGAGWTVATGRGSASGARMSDPVAAAYGPGVFDAQLAGASQAGASPLLLLALASVALGLILRKGSDVGLFSSKKSSTRTTNTFNDNRQVNDASNGGIVAGGNVMLSDPGAVRIAELNNELLGAVSEQQNDTVRFLADAGTDVIRAAGGSATDLFELSAANSAQAWDRTIDASQATIARLLDAAEGNNAVAGAAIAAFTPTENKQADGQRWALIAAAAFGAFILLRK